MSGVDWPLEQDVSSESVPLSDPSMPADLTGVIGYCSDKTVGEIPSSLVSPPTVHKCVQDAKNYLFGTKLEGSMRNALNDYMKVFYYYKKIFLYTGSFRSYFSCFHFRILIYILIASARLSIIWRICVPRVFAILLLPLQFM